MALAIDPLTPAFGAEIHGANLIGLDDTQFTELFRVFTAYGVVFLRDQPVLSPEQLMAFARKFGEIHLGPSYRQKSAEYPGLLRMRTNKDSRVVAGNRWHSDGSYDALAPQASILQLHKIPPVGGDTLFASLCAAWFTDDKLKDPKVLELASKVKGVGPVVTPYKNFLEFWAGSFPEIVVTVSLKGGKQFSRTLRFPKGHPRNRMSRDEFMDRFRLQASVRLEPDRIEKAIEIIFNLENVTDMSAVGQLMHNTPTS